MNPVATISGTRASAAALVALLLFGLVAGPGVAAAQETRAGGYVVVGPDETHAGDLAVTAGTAVVRGTVDGDLTAAGGTVIVAGDGVVTGDLEAAAGAVVLDGVVDGTARLGADEISAGPTARVGGDLLYDADADRVSVAPGATVAGRTAATDDLNFAVLPAAGPTAGFVPPSLPPGTFVAYGFFANLLLGAALLLVAPGFAREVATVGTTRPLRSGGVGLLAAVGAPVALAGLAVTVVGIPLSLVGFVAFGLLLWVALIYGALVVGTAALSLADVDSRWGALALGLLVVAVLGAIPFGNALNAVVALLGLGAFALALSDERRRRRESAAASELDRSPVA